MATPFLQLALSVYGVVFVAELPDKTALAALVLASRNPPLPVVLGSAAALTVQSAIAVAAGQLVSLLPQHAVHLVSGGVFLVSAVAMWLRKPDDKAEDGKEGGKGFWRTLWLVFGVVFLAEWGDLTQIATAALAARYAAPLAVFVGATAALWSVSAIAVLVGHRAGKLLSPKVTQKVAAVAFAVVGVALLAGLV
ncbi:MAG TPA: TMEM165/GDT1 family protein [Polyangiaceae bacterium]|jgi:putative Ca2+/H+ antiporter (TMEM165/GDT1 family)|nr:TMEM165/GDT1 family protein [Polyangiaceae bacterium]